MKTTRLWCALVIVSQLGYAQENLSYQHPPQEIMQLADYERAPSVQMDYKKENMLLMYRPTYKSLDDLNQEEIRLGGLRINPTHYISSTTTYISNLKLRKIKGKDETQIKGLPANARIANIAWSPDEQYISFTHTTSKGLELYIINVAKAEATKISGELKLNATLGNPTTWYADSQRLLVRVRPANAPALIDTKETLPTGPIVSVADGSVSQNRTYQDLLKNPTDEQNFDILTTSELYTIQLNGQATRSFSAALYGSENFSPDGNYLMITTIERPYSYIVPLSRFPMKTNVYDLRGQLIKTVNETALREVMPKGFMAVATGKRSMQWRADKGAELVFVEALDGGNPATKVALRDAVFTWKAPFAEEPQILAKTQQRYGGIIWGDDQTAIIMDQWYDTRNERTFLLNPSKPNSDLQLIFDRNSQDVYNDPGSFETERNQYGRRVLLKDGQKLFLKADGYTEKGQFPFLAELDLTNFKTKRIYQSKFTDKKEEIISIIDHKKGTALAYIQSKSEFPNYYIRDYKKNKLTPITQFKNPFESIKDVHKEVIHYERKDGVKLSGTLYLPKGYDKKKGEKLPLLIWAYPAEYKDKYSAGQSTQNPNEFTFPYYGSFVYWVTRGYAVLDDAAFPIIGEGETEPNDNFVDQLVWNAEAAIDAVDKLGYIDRKRVGVGGHSYGAFMTANLLSHSNLFACGIARSGAYNRTLTPFGFQREQRNYWEVPGVYNGMSPFMNAEKMKTPMLLVHGEADNNPGTFTLQTERYFQALKGLGAPARMVILPKESHSYVAKENILHLLWEQDQFLEKYLKPAKQ